MKWRRTVSMSAATYVRLRRHCEAHDEAAASLVDRLINTHLDRARAPVVTQAEAIDDLGGGAPFKPSRPLTSRFDELDQETYP